MNCLFYFLPLFLLFNCYPIIASFFNMHRVKQGSLEELVHSQGLGGCGLFKEV